MHMSKLSTITAIMLALSPLAAASAYAQTAPAPTSCACPVAGEANQIGARNVESEANQIGARDVDGTALCKWCLAACQAYGEEGQCRSAPPFVRCGMSPELSASGRAPWPELWEMNWLDPTRPV